MPGNQHPRQPTISDVARVAGVSKATASRVLSGHPATSENTRESVRHAADQLGFRPNAHARSLRSTHTNTIGLLIPDVRNPFFAELAHAVEQQALDLGLLTLLANADEDRNQHDRYLEVFLDQRIDGLIVAPQGSANAGSEDGTALEKVLRSGLPTVFIDRVLANQNVPSVTADHHQGIYDAVAHLANLGHQCLGFIAGPQETSTGRDRLSAFHTAIAAHGLRSHVAQGDFKEASGKRGAEELLAHVDRPSAIIAADSLMSLGAIRAFHEQGIRIGSDISLVAYDDIELFSLIDQGLTVISHDIDAMGRLSVELLQRTIAGEEPASLVLPSKLVVRASSQPITRKDKS